MTEVVRKLRGYEKHGDSLVVEITLPPIELSKLQKQFGLVESDPMYDAYEVTKDQRSFLQKYLKTTNNWEQYDWFIE
ncbi:MAG: hypothetical protein SWN10_23885 [Pseudomonadota bacterium]|nr:hypothetical protein [Pseudomonadota bacterium]